MEGEERCPRAPGSHDDGQHSAGELAGAGRGYPFTPTLISTWILQGSVLSNGSSVTAKCRWLLWWEKADVDRGTRCVDLLLCSTLARHPGWLCLIFVSRDVRICCNGKAGGCLKVHGGQ